MKINTIYLHAVFEPQTFHRGFVPLLPIADIRQPHGIGDHRHTLIARFHQMLHGHCRRFLIVQHHTAYFRIVDRTVDQHQRNIEAVNLFDISFGAFARNKDQSVHALAQKYFDHIAELVRILVRTAENNGIIKTGGIVLDFPAYLCKKAVRDIGNNHTDRPRTSAPQTSGRIIRLIVEFVSHFPNAFGHLIAYAITFPLIIHDERHQRYRNSGSFGNVTNRCTFSFHIAHIIAFYRKYILKRFSCKINRQNFTHKLIKILIINGLRTRSISITSSRHTP